MKELFTALWELPLPANSSFNLTTESGVEGYRAAWKALEKYADDKAKWIVQAKANGSLKGHEKVATKALKFLEKWRLHASATTELWNRTWEWKAVGESRDGLDVIYDWLKVKTAKKQWLAKEEKDLSRMTARLSKDHSNLFREHELLLVELEAVGDIS